MKLCAAQLRPVAGDVAANTAKHVALVERSAREHADVVFFPELSLTGYEPSLARSLAIDPHDPRLQVFQRLSDAHGIVVGVGLPLSAPPGVQIGMLWCTPGATPRTYAKQLLHADERPPFVPGDRQLVLDVNGVRLAPAICHESVQMHHADSAAGLGAVAYLASVAKGSTTLDRALVHYPDVAGKHGVFVALANAVGPSDDFVAAGRSAAWDDRGTLLAQMDGETEGLVVLDTLTRTARVHALAAW